MLEWIWAHRRNPNSTPGNQNRERGFVIDSVWLQIVTSQVRDALQVEIIDFRTYGHGVLDEQRVAARGPWLRGVSLAALMAAMDRLLQLNRIKRSVLNEATGLAAPAHRFDASLEQSQHYR